MPSFRKRIQWLSVSLIILLLLIFCVSLYTTLSILLHRHVDAQLLSVVQPQADRVKKETGEIEEFLHEKSGHELDDDDHLEHEDHELREAIRDSVVLSHEGHVQWKGEGVEIVHELDPNLKEEVLKGRVMYETIQPLQGSPIRRISYPIMSRGAVQYILQTQSPLDLVNETLQWLIFTLGAVTIGILVFGWLGSNWIARTALSPINTLGQTAANVSAQSLNTRVFLDAPYEEFQQLSKSFNNMLERLQGVFQSQRRFVGDAAHELKTPLTAMKGNLEVALQQDRSTEAYREVLSTSLGQVEHLARLVKSLVTLTRFSGEHPPIDRHPVRLKPLLKEVVSELSVLAEEKGCLLTAHLQEVPQVLGDAGQLKQLAINLLDNAIRHTPQDKSVTVTIQSSEDMVVLMVQDTGSGIATEHLPHIFERFYRADSARDRKSGGTGLGLAIAKEITLAHNGTITVQSEVGKGSVFTVNLPTILSNHPDQNPQRSTIVAETFHYGTNFPSQ
ncbi:MAG: ATP-binding protein [Nitrospirales bacterium]|nr:ATP-binding protein [Nitrospirales bacterium]